jgi:oligosaccharide repeat unit polymerase
VFQPALAPPSAARARLGARPNFIGASLFGVVASALCLLLLATDADNAPWGPGTSVTLAALLFALHLVLVAGRISPFDPIIWLPIAMLLFYFGRAALIEWFGIVPLNGYDPWRTGGLPLVERGYLTSLLSVAATLAGVHLAGVRRMTRVDLGAPGDRAFESAAMLFAIGSVVMVAAGVAIAGPSTVFGFYDQWYAAKHSGVDQRFIDMGIPFAQASAVALIASTARSARRRRIAAFLLFALVCFVALAKGDRTSVIAFGVGAGWVFTQRVARVRWPIVAALGIGAMALMPIIGEYRSSRSFAVTDTAPVSVLVSRTVAEMGMSGTAIVYAEKLVPERQAHTYGATFLLAAYELVPNVGLSKRFRPAEVPLSWNPSYWLAWTLDPNYAASGGGFGFSMTAEWYYNFGIAGVWLGGVLVGLFVARARNHAGNSPLALVWSATLFAGASIWVRNIVGYPLRVALWPVFGLWVIYRVMRALGPRPRRLTLAEASAAR